jgi:hypothetical protein
VKRTRHDADINPIAIKSVGKRLEMQTEGDFGGGMTVTNEAEGSRVNGISKPIRKV